MSFEPDATDLLGLAGTLRMHEADGTIIAEWHGLKREKAEREAREAGYAAPVPIVNPASSHSKPQRPLKGD